ncbi:hypothetical protein TNCV_4027211 [Trichonephila clavipes]|nr:hypothetical protein TNCV_4027211 [Trichonephila clavipes]
MRGSEGDGGVNSGSECASRLEGFSGRRTRGLLVTDSWSRTPDSQTPGSRTPDSQTPGSLTAVHVLMGEKENNVWSVVILLKQRNSSSVL